MAPRTASRCCRSVQTHVSTAASHGSAAASTTDGVWVTDALLTIAFERYCAFRFRRRQQPAHSRRFVGTTPGPLESRRRLGKRQMTEQLNLQQLHPSVILPPWALPTAPDLRQWEWSAPRDPQSRGGSSLSPHNVDTPSLAQLLSLPKWLTGESAASEPEPNTLHEETTTTPLPKTSAEAFFAVLDDWIRTDATIELEKEGTFLAKLDRMADEFRIQLQEAALTVDETAKAFDRIWEALEARRQRHNNTDVFPVSYAVPLCSALLEEMAKGKDVSCAKWTVDDLGSDFWQRFFVRVSALADTSDTARLATEMLLVTPPHWINRTNKALLDVVCRVLAHHSPETEAGISSSRTLAQKLTRALGHLREGQIDLLVRNVHKWMQTCDQHQQQQQHSAAPMQEAWLSTLAQLPLVPQVRFFAALAQATNKSNNNKQPAWTMTDDDLCDLLLTQWHSRGYATEQAQRAFRRKRQQPNVGGFADKTAEATETALADLAFVVFRYGNQKTDSTRLFKSLWKVLRITGRRDRLVPSIRAFLEECVDKGQQLPPAGLFECLAWATDDLDVAMQIHHLYVSSSLQQQQQQQTHHHHHQLPLQQQPSNKMVASRWHVQFWNHFAPRMNNALDRGDLTPLDVSLALDLAIVQNDGRATLRRQDRLHPAMVALVEKLATCFALDQRLTPRQALRGVERCHVFLSVHGGAGGGQDGRERDERDERENIHQKAPTSPIVLRALFHVVTGDLARRDPGRTERLRWLLKTIEVAQGPDTAAQTAKMLARWRDVAVRDAINSRRGW